MTTCWRQKGQGALGVHPHIAGVAVCCSQCYHGEFPTGHHWKRQGTLLLQCQPSQHPLLLLVAQQQNLCSGCVAGLALLETSCSVQLFNVSFICSQSECYGNCRSCHLSVTVAGLQLVCSRPQDLRTADRLALTQLAGTSKADLSCCQCIFDPDIV